MKTPDNRKRFLAIITGAISVSIGIIYLILITLLDIRGPMLPPPPEAFGVVLSVFDCFSLEVLPLYEMLS